MLCVIGNMPTYVTNLHIWKYKQTYLLVRLIFLI